MHPRSAWRRSATDIHRVYRVSLGTDAAYEALPAEGLKGPNGLAQ